LAARDWRVELSAPQIVGREAKPEVEHVGWSKYFRYNLDHKVVGIQYVVGVLMFFFTGGLLAMAIRTELLSPTVHVLVPIPTSRS